MPLPLLLAAAAVPTLYKGIQGIIQGNEADDLQKRDTTPDAFKELLARQRQMATSLGLPGEGQQLNRLNAGTNNVLAAGERAGTSSSSILGLLSSTNDTRARGLADLSTRSDAYHQQQEGYLATLMKQQAQYQRGDQQEYDRSKAALREASKRNIYNTVDAASQLAAYGIAKADAAKTGN